RKGAQQLSARDRGRLRERSRLRNAEERIRDLILQRRAEREVLRIKLVDVDETVAAAAQPEMIAARAHVANRHGGAAIGELPLKVDRPLLDPGRLAVLIDEVDVRPDARQQAERVAHGLRRASRKGIIETTNASRRRARNQARAEVVRGDRRVANLSVIDRARALI